jgi:hypothetical protein
VCQTRRSNNLLVERNESKLQELEGSFLFLCAHRHDKGGLLDMMRDGRLRAGFRRAIFVKYTETNAAHPGQIKWDASQGTADSLNTLGK